MLYMSLHYFPMCAYKEVSRVVFLYVKGIFCSSGNTVAAASAEELDETGLAVWVVAVFLERPLVQQL